VVLATLSWIAALWAWADAGRLAPRRAAVEALPRTPPETADARELERV
jgi:hypothetical protein